MCYINSYIEKFPIITRWILTPEAQEWDRKNEMPRSSRLVRVNEIVPLYQDTVKGMGKADFNIGHWIPSADTGHNRTTNSLTNCCIENANLNQTIY